MYKTILVPIDLEEEELTQKALSHAVMLAKIAGATLHLFHALPDASAFMSAYSFGIKEFENEAVVKADEKLHAIIKTIDLPPERLSHSLSFGTPRDEVLELADEIEADLIVVGSRRPNVKTYLLGSNAAAIVRHAKTTVLVVR
ncbi:universal stress protein [Pectobacteriaceae bacterium CE70]|uniref:Universal stress protein n=1 Tax=Serratia sp. (strain ATCC 39006) TaxID=104623 RepID=A0A2I5T643_SERS3|nr:MULTISPECIES: universal stress protein [Enterobacterales]WJV61462.1 universal stress protein [Pectobacteriaceae bacterium C52]WJV65736.1 universal stress protein [Pectobacteriaceae bacterium CE70]WJY09758.1 universal stress protein [Pectobacteriaceae bacterium C80]AUH00028.1 universal stress protein [Serratia sp. ATCC 39006]AUH04347.1 universal stress protein [Serratia sp. ATCC 39006]